MALNKLKIAIVCDWLTNSGGAEKIIIGLHQLFPNAPIYTSIYNPNQLHGLEKATIYTSYLQRFPFAKRRHQLYLGLMPHVFEQFNLDDYDLVISSSHSCAKGIITKPQTLHISYCHSPMRYAWENSINYIKEYEINPLLKTLAPFFIHKIRMWDRLSADRVDNFIANSNYVKDRISKFYRKPSTVIHPFIDVKKYKVNSKRDQFYLAVGRLTAYKKFDLIIETFNRLRLPLKIVGTGVSLKKLKAMAHPNIEFLGYVSDEQLHELYQKARALIFPQIEDFGITPLEAMATGCPVIAYGQGGALETVIDDETGILFKQQNVHTLMGALEKFQKKSFDTQTIRKHAEQFDRSVFNDKIVNYLEKKWENHIQTS